MAIHSPKRGRRSSNLPPVGKGDLLDLLLEVIWYHRPSHLSLLEKRHSLLIVFILVIVWYTAAIGAITTSKKLMMTIQVPYTLCAFQFLCAAVMTGITASFSSSSTSRTRESEEYDKDDDDVVGDLDGLEGGEYQPSPNRRNVAMMPLSSLNRHHYIAPSQSSDVKELRRQYETTSWLERGKGKPLKRHRSLNAQTNNIYSSSGNGNDDSRDESDLDGELPYDHSSFFNIFPLPFTHPYTLLLLGTAVSYTCGFLFTNLAFSLVSTSFAETIKSGEPLSSVLLGYLILREKSSVTTYFTLIPIVIGVALCCISDTSLHLYGALFAFLSNIAFSLRAVLAKMLLGLYPQSINTFTMFGHISVIGLGMLLPLAYTWERDELYRGLVTQRDPGRIDHTCSSVFLLFLCNGIAYTTYNLTSFLVLNRSNIATHAVLNVFRRVFIIIFTSYYFMIPMSTFNLMGVGIAVTGVILFGLSKQQAKQAMS